VLIDKQASGAADKRAGVILPANSGAAILELAVSRLMPTGIGNNQAQAG